MARVGGGFTKSEAPVYDHDSKLAKLQVQLAHNAVGGLIHETSGSGNQTSNLRTLHGHDCVLMIRGRGYHNPHVP